MVPDKGHYKSCRMPWLLADPTWRTCRVGSPLWLPRPPFALPGRGGGC